MSDISEQQMDELISAMNKSAGSLGKIASSMGDTTQASAAAKANSNAGRQAQMEDTRATQQHSKAVQESASFIKRYGARITGLFSIDRIEDGLTNYGKELTKTYRDLSNYGQSFAGNMFKLGQLAGQAGLPLEQFAAAVRKNSVVVNQLGGVTRFAELSKRVRTLTQQAGMYGYTVEQLNDFGLDMLETQRLAGKNLANISSEVMSRRIQSFALNVTAVSDALGAQREIVMEMAMENLRSEAAASAARLNSLRGLDAYNDAMMDAVAALAAQPGEAGKMLSKGLADAFGSINGALFTDLGKDFIAAGQSSGLAVIDEANRRIAAGEDSQIVAMETVSKLAEQLQNPETMQSLRLLAQTGNESANRILAIADNLKTYTKADLDAKKKERMSTDNLSDFMLSWQNTLNTLKGALIDGFLTPFMTMGKLDPAKVQAFWDQINNMAPVLKDFAKQFGTLLTTFLTPSNLRMAGDALIGFTKLAITATQTIGGIVGQISNAFKIFHDGAELLFGKEFAGLATVLAGVTAWFGSKALINAVMGFFMRSISGNLVTVHGRVVNVNGGAGGAGDIGDLLDGGGDGKKKGGGGGRGRRGGRMDARLRALKNKGLKKGLKGIELEKYMLEGATKAGRFERMAARIPGGKALTAFGGRMAGMGRVMSGPMKAIGRFGGPVTAALVAGLTIADATNTIKDINEAVASGKMTPQDARKALGKMVGATSGSIAGSVIGGIVGQALIPIPGVGAIIGAGVGGAIGNWAGGAAGKFVAGVTAPKTPPVTGTPQGARAAAAQPRAVTAQPRVLDDRIVAQLRTDAILGDRGAIDQLRKIEEGLRNQTAILASQQAKQTQAVRETNYTLKSAGGFGGG